ncbi:hypothetical protein [Lawsonibacter sp. JLR.KK007]|uniref:hypothetical protein n=1 Tax=Lawsonibacter sp. JLR.KK007 TaxID=3114293 RepID=UPI002FEF54E2
MSSHASCRQSRAHCAVLTRWSLRSLRTRFPLGTRWPGFAWVAFRPHRADLALLPLGAFRAAFPLRAGRTLRALCAGFALRTLLPLGPARALTPAKSRDLDSIHLD